MAGLTVSVIIPTFNRAHLIERALNSVLTQIEDGDEVIVIDDGSSDNTAEVVARCRDRVRYIRTKNRGAGAARNTGIQVAANPLVSFLDSDDEWMPGHLLLLRSFMESRPDLLFCFTNYVSNFHDGSVRHFALESHTVREPNWHEIMGASRPASSFMTLPAELQDFLCFEGDYLYRSLCLASYVSVDTLIVRRKEAGDSLQFSEDTATAEEWECAARLARAGKSAYLHFETARVHHHEGQQLTKTDTLAYLNSRITIMRRIWGADLKFLHEHGQYYECRLREEQLSRIERFLVQGSTDKARFELADTKNPPFSLHLLANLPGRLTKSLLDIRRAIKLKFK